jgi:hypothetical protein
MNRIIITFCIVLYAIAVPFLEINDTHVFNPDWTPHVRIHEVWQLITNSGIGFFLSMAGMGEKGCKNQCDCEYVGYRRILIGIQCKGVLRGIHEIPGW